MGRAKAITPQEEKEFRSRRLFKITPTKILSPAWLAEQATIFFETTPVPSTSAWYLFLNITVTTWEEVRTRPGYEHLWPIIHTALENWIEDNNLSGNIDAPTAKYHLSNRFKWKDKQEVTYDVAEELQAFYKQIDGTSQGPGLSSGGDRSESSEAPFVE